MRRAPPALDAMVRAFRELTDAPADGAATRARVLANAGRTASRRLWLRRVGIPIAAVLVALSSVSAALPLAQRRWRAATRVRVALQPPVTLAPVRRGEGRGEGSVDDKRRSTFPGDPLTLALSPEDGGEGTGKREKRVWTEAAAYGRAHRAHFLGDRPARALAAWDDYLAAFPRGRFAPEAAYNRAICLVRLGRYAQAARGLRPFARQPAGAYRRAEARQLLDGLGEPSSEDSSGGLAPATKGGEERARYGWTSGQPSGSPPSRDLSSTPDRGRVHRLDPADSGPR